MVAVPDLAPSYTECPSAWIRLEAAGRILKSRIEISC